MLKVTLFSIVSFICLNNAAAITYYYMDNYCGGMLDMTYIDAIRLKLTSKSSYRPNMACSLQIKSTKATDKFMLYFKDIDIEEAGSCKRDWLEVHDGTNIYSPYVSGLSGKLCGFYISSTVRKTTGNSLYLYFKSDNTLQDRGFDMVITKYHTGFCNSDEYSCSNGRCISDDLVCNGYNPCGDYSDCAAVVIAAGAIAGIVIGSICFIVILTAVVIVCRRRRVRHYGHVHQPVNVVATSATNYGAGYNQPIPQQYPTVSPPNYPTGQQYPPVQYPN